MSTPTSGWATNSHRQEPSRAGLVLADGTGLPVYYNREAIAVLTYPQPVKNLAGSDLFQREVQTLLLRLEPDEAAPYPTAFKSGRRRYVCRAFAVLGSFGTRSHPLTGLLIERDSPRMVNVSEAAEQFRLTQREQEAIELLTLGLTSKEIASRMNISPNTVKAFFRLVMTKMGVSTRSGIVGKIARM